MIDLDLQGQIRNRFINLGRPIFPLNHSGASAAMVFTIPTTFGIAHAQCYARAERATKYATRVRSSLLDSLTVPSTHYVPQIVFTFSPICHACSDSIAIYLNFMRYFIFLCIGPHHFFLVVIAGDGGQRNQTRDCAIPRAPENMSHKISYLFSYLDVISPYHWNI